MKDEFVRCIECNSHHTISSLPKDTIGCPVCGTSALPLFPSDDVTVEVNWHELRVLGQAAERWSSRISSGASSHSLDTQRVINSICGRLMAQHPDKDPLTLSAELAKLRGSLGDTHVLGFTEDTQANDDER